MISVEAWMTIRHLHKSGMGIQLCHLMEQGEHWATGMPWIEGVIGTLGEALGSHNRRSAACWTRAEISVMFDRRLSG